MTSPRDSIDAQHKKIDADLERVRAIWRRRAVTSPQVQIIFADVDSEADILRAGRPVDAFDGGEASREQVDAPEFLRSQIREVLGAGRDKNAASLKRLNSLLSAQKSQLAENATPRVDPQREAAARDELYLLVRNAADLEQAMMEAVKRGGELAAAAASSYGESLLRARGAHKLVEAHEQVKAAARNAALKSEDAVLRAAAEAHDAVDGKDGLAGLQTRATYLAHIELQEAEAAAAGL